MSRMKTVFAGLVVTAMAAVALPASATTDTIQIAASGSSAIWQTIALAAYDNGTCLAGAHKPCQHYTDNAKFNLNDSRPTLNGLGGTLNQDPGDLWIVWDTPSGTQKRNVWVFIKVDSIVGDRCFYASPRCTITQPSGYNWAVTGGKIDPALWGADTVPPADVQALFAGNGVTVNSAASDIRPEDALFESCRVNSLLGNGAPGFGDGLDGLGYGTNPQGTCAQFGATLGQLVGNPIKSGIAGSTATANVLAFNITGHDPFTNATIATPTVLNVGADPIMFVFSRSTTVNPPGLLGATNITDAAAQTVFSGADCDAHVIDAALPAGTAINAYLREPLSGTMTTTEMSVLRRPTKTVPPQAVLGVSQEKNVGAANPLNNPCAAPVGSNRVRGIGTGEVVNGNGANGGVLNSGGANLDGIAYAFFSFGNFSKIKANAKWGYLTLNGVDPIGPLAAFPNQELPQCTVPCTEASIWGSAGTSFPQLRAGNYTAWSTIRFITAAASAAAAKTLVSGSNVFAACSTPDYIPAAAVGGSCSDPGMKIWHTHYQQRDGNDNKLGGSPKNGTFNAAGNPTGGDVGGDAGGCTISSVGLTQTFENNFIQTGVGSCVKDRD